MPLANSLSIEEDEDHTENLLLVQLLLVFGIDNGKGKGNIFFFWGGGGGRGSYRLGGTQSEGKVEEIKHLNGSATSCNDLEAHASLGLWLPEITSGAIREPVWGI